jgi:hypothetical protein
MQRNVTLLSKDDRYRALGTGFIHGLTTLSAMNILFNGFIFSIIVCTKKLRKTFSNIAIANFLLTLVFANLIAVLYNCHVTDIKVEVVQKAILPFFIALMVMAVDRFLSIRFPFQYEGFSYHKTIVLITLVIWSPIIIGFPITAVGEFEFDLDLTEIVVTLTAMVILVTANTYVYIVALHHLRTINVQISCCQQYTAKWRKTWRSLLISFSLTAMFLCGFTMNLVIKILRVTGHMSLEKEMQLNRINYPIMTIKCFVSPVICVVLSKCLRKAVLAKVWRKEREIQNEKQTKSFKLELEKHYSKH